MCITQSNHCQDWQTLALIVEGNELLPCEGAFDGCPNLYCGAEVFIEVQRVPRACFDCGVDEEHPSCFRVGANKCCGCNATIAFMRASHFSLEECSSSTCAQRCSLPGGPMAYGRCKSCMFTHSAKAATKWRRALALLASELAELGSTRSSFMSVVLPRAHPCIISWSSLQQRASSSVFISKPWRRQCAKVS